MTNKPWTCILFDLDGTITDSAPGITATLAHTLEQLDRPVPTPFELIAFVGPPIMDGFAELGLVGADAQRALAVYRERYQSHGAFDSSLYSGVPEVLEAVAEAGIPLGVATSKPETQARRILGHFGLLQHFAFVGGASDDELRSAKADVVAYSLANLRQLGVDLSRTVLVGDREHDVHGAAAHGIPTIFVDWGYGNEIEAAGAIAIAHSAPGLRQLLLPD